MKKIVLTILAIVCMSVYANAYKPTQNDIGEDCTTENGKLGTWKNVRVEEEYNNSNSRGTSESGSITIGGRFGTRDSYVEGNISGSGSSSNSSTSGKSEKIIYDDIRCIEDKNANLPKQSPVRGW